MRTATTTLTRTNCAISTKTTKNIGAMIVLTQQLRTQSVSGLQSSFSASYQHSGTHVESCIDGVRVYGISPGHIKVKAKEVPLL